MLTMKLNDWIKHIGEIANEICNNPDSNRIKLKTSDNGQHRGFIIESNDAGALAAWVRLSKDNLDEFNFKTLKTY
jgi:hypothetical protein